MEPTLVTSSAWTLPQKILFRFLFVYFILFCFPFPLDAFEFTWPITKPYHDLRIWSISQIGNLFFNIEAESLLSYRQGRDDSFNFILRFVSLFIAGLTSLIWSFADRHRANYEKLDQWFRLYLRYYLVFMMLGYGFNKVFLIQGTPFSASKLALPYGMQTPKQVFWQFMGYSKSFMAFTGYAEVVGGLLLLWRRTVTIGAIILLSVLSVVVMVNYCFDIGVGLFSLHFLLISIYLLWKDSKRLANFFFLNKPIDKIAYVPLVSHPIWRKVFLFFQLLLVTCTLVKHVTDNMMYHEWINVPRPLDGIYDTEYFIRGKDTIPPLQTDSLRWKRLIIDIQGEFYHLSHIQLSADTIKYCNTNVDTVDKIIKFQFKTQDGYGAKLDSCRMAYSLPDSSHLFLQGIWKNDSIKVMMKKYDLNNYPLYREKFNWKIDKSAI